MNAHQAAAAGDLVALQQALADADALESVDSQGRTPLMVAVISQQAGPETVHWLIERGADVNAQSEPQPVIDLSDEILEFMAEAGQDVSFIREANATPQVDSVLSLAARHAPAAKVRLLLEAGADPQWSDPQGYTPLHQSLYREDGWEAEGAEETRGVAALLLDAGADVEAVTSYNEWPLGVAARRGDLPLVRLLLDRGADIRRLHWGSLHREVAFGEPAGLRNLLAGEHDIEGQDLWERTPLLLAAHLGRTEMAQMLLEAGADLAALDRTGADAAMLAVEGGHPQTLRWLAEQGVSLERDAAFDGALEHAVTLGRADCLEVVLEHGVDVWAPCGNATLMHEAGSTEVAELLEAAGLPLDDLPASERPALLGVNADPPLQVTAEQFKRHRLRQFGQSNPTPMDNPFWTEMIRTRLNAWQAGQQFDFEHHDHDRPTWCADRFGQSLTRLPSGELVEIGGEHEDSYDPDFCIYNDVLIHDGAGGCRILGYPRELFPPTDFHSATCRDGSIYIVGSLGYGDERSPGETPVFRLDCGDWTMHRLETAGESPGWISRHQARLLDDGKIEIWGGQVWDGEDLVPNKQRFVLDIERAVWRSGAD